MKDFNDNVDPPTIGRVFLAFVVTLAVILFCLVIAHVARARDLDGRYVNSPLHDWFNHLASGKGLCCSFADGSAIEDADWETSKDGKHYRVRIPDKATPGDPMIWVDVPDEAVITEPNRAGRTMVWPVYGYSGVSVRCFMPGSMT